MEIRRWVEERWSLLREQTRFTGPQLIVLTLLALLMGAGGLLAARETRTKPVVRIRSAVNLSIKPARKTKPKKFLVHVAGAVAKPGLYEIDADARIAKAVELAGGATGEADLDALNLAAILTDGQKIFVPLKGRSVDQAGGDANTPAPLALNSATVEQLVALDGVGPVLAKRIDTWRRRHGRFISLNQLDEVEGIGPKKFSLLKEQLTLD